MQNVIKAGLVGLIAAAIIGADVADVVGQHSYDVLVFSKTEGFRHNSIEAGVEAIKALGAEHDFGVFATENADYFRADSLQHFRAVVFLNTSGDAFDADQEEGLMSYIQSGGGWVGIHAAATTEYDWEWYGGLVGAYFSDHPDVQPADIAVTDRLHPSTKELPLLWNHTDEWYNYRLNPRTNVHVLAVVKESSYEGEQWETTIRLPGHTITTGGVHGIPDLGIRWRATRIPICVLIYLEGFSGRRELWRPM